MHTRKWIRNGFTLIILAQFLLSLVAPVNAFALEAQTVPQHPGTLPAALSRPVSDTPTAPAGGVLAALTGTEPSAPAAPSAANLDVQIWSSPWAVLDHNNPTGATTPHVFVVEARVTNNGPDTATNTVVTLDYNEDPANNWVLLSGEDPERKIPALGAGQSYYVYWFARYSSTIGATHTYTVMADADNASPVSTSTNHFENPDGETVKTRSYLSTGNSGISQTSADIIVGVAFTVTVSYDLGTDPRNLVFSPTGDPNFNSGAYRLLSSGVRFYNDAGTWENTVPDQLYFNTVDANAQNAEATFTFIALTPADASLCAYAAVGYSSTQKYDKSYCSAKDGTVIDIGGSLSLSMYKQASHTTIQQGETLSYTIQYSNTGDLPISYAWIWDDVDTAIASIDTASIDPAYDPGETTASRVAWYIGNIGAYGAPTSLGTMTFDVDIDGNGLDLVDGTKLVNYAFFGVEPGSLPNNAALTSIFTTTVQAPVISIQKSDGSTNVEPGGTLTYTLQIDNSGSVAATSVVITDVLPAYVTPVGTPTPAPDSVNGQTLVWTSLGPIAAGGGSLTIKIPAQVDIKAPNGIQTNQATIQYSNEVGYVFATKSATDDTTVNAPVLSISKSDYPDPVLTGRTIQYTLNYANSGPAAASNVVITDVVPISTTFKTGSCIPSCTVSDGVVTWNLGSVAGSSNGSVQFSVTVDSDLETGALIYNDDYGIASDQTDFYAGAAITTLVRRDAAIFEGTAFVDDDGDGVYNEGVDSTLTGITVTLQSASLVTDTLTDANGYYRFRMETEDPVSITADDWPGYFHTTPETVFLDSTLGVTTTVNFGYASTGSGFGVIYGTVFQDDDHDGSQNLGEVGLVGVEIISGEAASSPATTNDHGQYILRFDSSETVTITESNPLYYVSTTPDSVQASAVTGSSGSSPVDFGDFLGVKITGQVFDDANVNGEKDPLESGLAGAGVAADGENYTTLSSGEYTLYVSLPDTSAIQIVETDPSGYVSTNAIPGDGMSRVDANTLEISAPISGTVYSGGDFGDAMASSAITITGKVWNDNGTGGYLANGVLDPGEPGLAGAVVSLSSGLTQTTGIDGSFLLYGPPDTVITITETNPGVYVSTNAIPGNAASKVDNDTLVVSALSGGSTSSGNLFGDVLSSSAAVVSGTVFDDLNKNGVLDAGEPGLAGVQVTLEIENGATIPVTTGADGEYQFAVTPGKNIRITSDGPGGSYLPTTSETIYLSPPAPGTFPDNNFGYGVYAENVAVVYGIVFDDVNSDGEQGFGELGLEDAVVELNSASTTTSGSGGLAGRFAFTVTHTIGEEVVYAVHETNPTGYRSTTPDVLNVPVLMGNSYYVEFGDTNHPNTASIYGTAFDDFDGDGVQDENEPGLPGVVISMTIGTGIVTDITKAYGQFTYGFFVTEAGYHTVSEQDPAKEGYRSTTPDSINVYVEPGNSYKVNFGDTNGGFATITGIVYYDEDGRGTLDPSELGIPNVEVKLANGISATTLTREWGDYTFRVDEEYLVRVSETDPDGYHSTTPNTVTLNIDTSKTYLVNFGDSDKPLLSSIFGTVFDDANANGAWDLGELGLPGIAVGLSNGATESYTTNNLGQYTFQIDTAGVYTVTETDAAGWVSTNAIPGDPAVTKVDNNRLRVDVTLGTDYGENLFGDILASQVYTVTGAVWDDNGDGGGVRGDGLRNGTEPGLAGATVGLSSGMSHVTGADGGFTLHAPAGQPVTVSETNPSGYTSTGAIHGNDASVVDLDTLVVSALSGGAISAGNLFGDVSSGSVVTITGTVFEDANGNGLRDVGEAGIPGVEITLDGTTTHTTNANGLYIFFTPVAGTHTLVEEDKTGYFSTTPNEVNIEAELGKSYVVDFGDVLTAGAEFASIFGTVFEDLNGNGEQDDGELGIAGVTVTLDGGATASTNLLGGYTFSTTVTGPHTVVEQDKAGYFSTTPNEVQVNVASLGAGYQVDFGDALISGSEFASVYGTVFEDANGNGEQDEGELGIAGVTVTLDGGATASTNLLGGYTFSTTLTGPHTVVEQDKTGYFSTTPNEVQVNVASLGSGYQVDFGDAKTDSGFASIFGTVFEDLNGNGEQDAGELGIAGVTITLDGGATASTNLLGGYTFSITVTGTHTVIEQDKAGYFSTTPNEVQVNVASLGSGHQVDFGDALSEGAEFASIYGTVFEDANGNGEQDEGELGIAGVTVTLDGGATASTNLLGGYTFSTTITGPHTVVEQDKTGYFSTTPNEVQVNVASLGVGYQVDFGDAKTSSGFAAIYGIVFNDANGNGKQDSGELSIEGVTITLDGGATATTNLYGGYTFSTTLTGAHTVIEQDKAGYFSTTPNEVQVDVASLGAGYQVDFGDALISGSNFGTIYGTVFEDLNGSGVQDAGEFGIKDVTVKLDGTKTTTTDEYGNYSFSTTQAGMHKVVETDPDGYFSTTPNEVHVTVALKSSKQVDFGDAPDTSNFAAIFGTVFVDSNEDTFWDALEPGISGVTITLDGGVTAVTNMYGSYTFSTTLTGDRSVVETDPEGYVSTTPNNVVVNVAWNTGYEVNFGDNVECDDTPDAFEEDDTAAQAKEIQVGAAYSQTHNFYDDPTDWIAFTVSANDVYTITTSSWGQRADTVLALFDTDGETMLVANDDYEGTTDFSSRIVWQAPSDGVYYIRVTNKAGLTRCYTDYDIWVDGVVSTIEYIYLPLVMRDVSSATSSSPETLERSPAEALAPLGVINHICPDAYEVDDTWEQAAAISTGVLQVHSFDSNPNLYAADKDLVWFDLTAGDTVTFTIGPVTGTLPLMELFDETGVSMGITETQQIIWTMPMSGDMFGHYYLSVSPQTQSFGCADVAGYGLTMEVFELKRIYLPLVVK